MAAAPELDRDLPWSKSRDPWAILVSEVMLQQTSVARVREPWVQFLAQFPTPRACADAALSDVLRAWGALGYPRRARNLHRSARMIRDECGGAVPHDVDDLLRLPGVGDYTARAVAAFAFGEPVGVLDTNVGRVLARCVENRSLTRREAQQLVTDLVGDAPPRTVNQALLDLGAIHCRAIPRCDTCPVASLCRWRRDGGDDPSLKSAGVSRAQPAFAGSDRQARGRLLHTLRDGSVTISTARRVLGDEPESAARRLESLVRDGLVSVAGRRVTLASGD